MTFNLGRICTVLGVSTYTISEAAVRSGFSPSALRYYESIGLVEPSSRTAAQYRLYDDDDLARLAFIARAKQLGCTLDEINDLVGIWDGEQCGPVQKQFHDLVTTKLADTERQIRELTALAEQLRQAAGRLAGPAVDGPCDEGCACLALDNAVAPVEFVPESAMSQADRTGHGVLGLGVAACAVCCAGPILAFLGGLGLVGLASTFVIGWVGLLVVAATIVAYIVLRRRRASCAAPATTVNVAPPTRRTPQATDSR